MLKYKCEMFTCKNTKSEDKPNEDLAVFDSEQGIGMVLDGVSRDKENGVYPNPSPARIASQLFAKTILKKKVSKSSLGIEKIREMICAGNEEIRKYNNELQHRFPAGTVGVVFEIKEDKFYYGYIGDCYASIIRDGMMKIITECQTTMVAKHKQMYSSDEIRFNICNHINHPCGYGVWDGNEGAIDFVKYGVINLIQGDVILVYTDGLEKEMAGKKVSELEKEPLSILDDSASCTNKDDRTCMRISFC